MRLRPITHTRAKQLVPVANKPVLFYGLESLAASGIHDVGIVVGETGEEIRRVVGDGAAFGLRVRYIEQEAPLGLAHAVKIARDFIQDDPFVVYLGDNLILSGIKGQVDNFRKVGPNCQILLAKVQEPNRFGVATVMDGKVVRLVEKPREPESDLALVGVYMFDRSIFQAVDKIVPSSRGELEITDAIQWLVDGGFDVRYDVIGGWWKDTGRLEDLLEANRTILDTLDMNIEGELRGRSQAHFKVVIEKGARVIDSSIRGPALIGRGSEVINSYIGPFTSIGYGCKLEGCEIEHSIVMANCTIKDVASRITDSLIGENCMVYGVTEKPRAHRLMLGDNCRVGVGE